MTTKIVKTYLISGYFCGKLVSKKVMQINISMAITRFCVENSVDEEDVIQACEIKR